MIGVKYKNQTNSSGETIAVNGFYCGHKIGAPTQDSSLQSFANSQEHYAEEYQTVRIGTALQDAAGTAAEQTIYPNCISAVLSGPNFGRYTVEGFKRSAAQGVDYEANIKVSGTIAEESLTQLDGAYTGKWVGVLIDFGMNIQNVNYVTKTGDLYQFSSDDIKQANGFGASNSMTVDLWSRTDTDFTDNHRDLTFKLAHDSAKTCVIRLNLC